MKFIVPDKLMALETDIALEIRQRLRAARQAPARVSDQKWAELLQKYGASENPFPLIAAQACGGGMVFGDDALAELKTFEDHTDTPRPVVENLSTREED